MTGRRTDLEYERELRKLREQLLLMGAKVEELIASSVKALVDRDDALARRLLVLDDDIDHLERETDELCSKILAKRQPVASDLRAITTAMKMVTELERIGDLCVNLCEQVIELGSAPSADALGGLPELAERVQQMLRSSLDAYVARDATGAREVIAQDRTVDEAYARLSRRLLGAMLQGPSEVSRGLRLQSIAKTLERIGDHATNLAEMVIFMVDGEDVRHLGHSGGSPATSDDTERSRR